MRKTILTLAALAAALIGLSAGREEPRMKRVWRVIAPSSCRNRLLLLLPGLLAGVLLSTALPSSAAVVVARDRRGDVPARIDLTQASYTNGPKVIQLRAHVVDLRETGTFWFNMSMPAGNDGWYVARVTNRGVRLGISGNFGVDWRGCRGMRSTWQPHLNLVTATVPHSCLQGTAYRRALLLWVRSELGPRQGDFTPMKTVRRG